MVKHRSRHFFGISCKFCEGFYLGKTFMHEASPVPPKYWCRGGGGWGVGGWVVCGDKMGTSEKRPQF